MKTVQTRSGGTNTQERRAMLRVLVVDDAPEIRFLFEIALSREPKVKLVGQAENGRQALEKIELLRPELVVMDMKMPVMDGLAATRRIKEQWPQVEVVGYTSSGPQQAHLALQDAGAARSFDKTDLKELLEFVRDRASRTRVS